MMINNNKLNGTLVTDKLVPLYDKDNKLIGYFNNPLADPNVVKEVFK